MHGAKQLHAMNANYLLNFRFFTGPNIGGSKRAEKTFVDLVGLAGFEPATPRSLTSKLSVVCSNYTHGALNIVISKRFSLSEFPGQAVSLGSLA
jgi:hypothetical protein